MRLPVARMARVSGAALIASLLAACSVAPSVSRLPDAGPTTTEVQPTVTTTADLKALKKAAGIPDCPASDATVAPVPGGLPDVVVPCLGDGREVRLAGLRGKPMLVSLWAQWCGPCRDEAPYLAQMARRSGSKLVVLGVDFHDGYPDRAIEFARLARWDYPQLQDAGSAFAQLQVTAPPMTFLVRPDGTIAARHAGGFRSTEQITALVRTHLGVDL
jgi:cytochrome c biogenesis protein CcmG/thiol:disulfide interchange protein DsbE